MYVDALTTSAVVEQLKSETLGGRVQEFFEIDDVTIGFEIYGNQKRHYLLISAHPQHARCHLVSSKMRRGVETSSPLGLLIKKYVKGGKLNAISQPPHERILIFDFSHAEGETQLIVETMDRRSNIILVRNGIILECIKRISGEVNRHRVILPGKPYATPPPINKVSPENVTPELLQGYLTVQSDKPVTKILVKELAGISPLLAKEIVYRATEDENAEAFDVSGKVLFQALDNILTQRKEQGWAPCIVPVEKGEAGYVAFAPYLLTHMEGTQSVANISEAMETYFGAPVGREAYTASKSSVREQVDQALERARRKLHSLEQQQADNEKMETLRIKGELVLAYGYSLEAGQTQFSAQYEMDGPEYTITVELGLTAPDNAQRYFDKYEKAKRAAEGVPKLLQEAQRDYQYLQQISTDLDLAESWPEIDAVRETLQRGGYWQGAQVKGPRSGKPGIRRIVTEDGFVILVGRNADQNHLIVTERAGQNDIWLHARSVPGSHVLIKNDGRAIPDKVIRQAAGFAAYYSAKRHEGKVEVDITERRHVRPVKGAYKGLVTYKNEETIQVKPRSIE